MPEEPKPHPIEEIDNAGSVVDYDIAHGHGRMPKAFARNQLARFAPWVPVPALHAEVDIFWTVGLDCLQEYV
jgi:hypothetical protein